jgi:protein TonB
LIRPILAVNLLAGVQMSRLFTFVAVALVLLAGLSMAQSPAPAGNSARKVITRIAPDYPELARRMNIRGVVKIEAVVRASGSVKSTRIVGGNPVLVDAAVHAVEKWKFEPAQSESTEVVQLAFGSQ